MIDIKAFLDSGIIEDYCLGIATTEAAAQLEGYCMQYPEIKLALEKAQQDMISYMQLFEKAPPQHMLDGILQNVTKDIELEKAKLTGDSARLSQFIPISKHSDYQKWQRLTKELNPPQDFDIHSHELFNDESNILCVVWIKDRIPSEEHDDLLESILCVEGTCVGKLDNETIPLSPGDFWQIPLHADHTLEVTSDHPVKLILMRQIAV